MFAGLNCELRRGVRAGWSAGKQLLVITLHFHIRFNGGVIFSVAMAARCEQMTRCVRKVADGRCAENVVFGANQSLDQSSRDLVSGKLILFMLQLRL